MRSDTRQVSALAISTSFEKLTRLAPLSYFWICWNVSPTAAPRADCESPSDLA